MATSALAALAFAQSIPVPPTRELIDANGVDLFRGTFTVDETVASLWLQGLERSTGRALLPRKPGRKPAAPRHEAGN